MKKRLRKKLWKGEFAAPVFTFAPAAPLSKEMLMQAIADMQRGANIMLHQPEYCPPNVRRLTKAERRKWAHKMIVRI